MLLPFLLLGADAKPFLVAVVDPTAVKAWDPPGGPIASPLNAEDVRNERSYLDFKADPKTMENSSGWTRSKRPRRASATSSCKIDGS